MMSEIDFTSSWWGEGGREGWREGKLTCPEVGPKS